MVVSLHTPQNLLAGGKNQQTFGGVNPRLPRPPAQLILSPIRLFGVPDTQTPVVQLHLSMPKCSWTQLLSSYCMPTITLNLRNPAFQILSWVQLPGMSSVPCLGLAAPVCKAHTGDWSRFLLFHCGVGAYKCNQKPTKARPSDTCWITMLSKVVLCHSANFYCQQRRPHEEVH